MPTSFTVFVWVFCTMAEGKKKLQNDRKNKTVNPQRLAKGAEEHKITLSLCFLKRLALNITTQANLWDSEL